MADNANSKRILLVNDMAGYGKVALAAMIPILSSAHHQVFNLPTALVSNTLDYGTFDILETTGYMRGAIDAWEKLGFEFDAVATGFLVSEEQTKLVADFCHARHETGATVFVDPIMGDEGSLYNGVSEATVGFTERTAPGAEGLTRAEAEELVAEMHELGAAKVIVTSCAVDGEHATLVSDGAGSELAVLPYDEVPVRFPGTGDIFSAVLIADMLGGVGLVASTQRAMDVVRDLLVRCEHNEDKFKGIPIELYLDRIAEIGQA